MLSPILVFVPVLFFEIATGILILIARTARDANHRRRSRAGKEPPVSIERYTGRGHFFGYECNRALT